MLKWLKNLQPIMSTTQLYYYYYYLAASMSKAEGVPEFLSKLLNIRSLCQLYYAGRLKFLIK